MKHHYPSFLMSVISKIIVMGQFLETFLETVSMPTITQIASSNDDDSICGMRVANGFLKLFVAVFLVFGLCGSAAMAQTTDSRGFDLNFPLTGSLNSVDGANHCIILDGGGVANSAGLIPATSNDQGWLELTPNKAGKRGWAIIDKAFRAPLGVALFFEYRAWAPSSDALFPRSSLGLADGLSFFLFDGTIPPANFIPGGCGSGLM